jgi:hypothetical protein
MFDNRLEAAPINLWRRMRFVDVDDISGRSVIETDGRSRALASVLLFITQPAQCPSKVFIGVVVRSRKETFYIFFIRAHGLLSICNYISVA